VGRDIVNTCILSSGLAGGRNLPGIFRLGKIVLCPLEKSFRFIPAFQSNKPYASHCCVRLYLVGVTGFEPVTSTV